MRSDLESHNRSYWDQLVSSLKTSITQDASNIQSYINQSTAALTRQPLTMEEVGETGIEFENIIKKSEEVIFIEFLIDKCYLIWKLGQHIIPVCACIFRQFIIYLMNTEFINFFCFMFLLFYLFYVFRNQYLIWKLRSPSFVTWGRRGEEFLLNLFT